MPCLTRPSSFHTSLPWTKSGDFATANKALTTLKFKEMKMTAVKRNIKSLLNEMGMASQPPNHSDAKGKVEEKVQGSNCAITEGSDARVQYGAMRRGSHDNCRQHFSVNVKISNTWWVWHNFENVWKRLLRRRIFSSGLRCNVKYFEFWWFPVSDLHHEISSCLFFTFVLLQQFSQKFHWQVATMAEGAGWSESAPRGQDSAQQSKTAKTTQSDAEFQTGLLGCNKVAKKSTPKTWDTPNTANAHVPLQRVLL